MNVNSVYMKSVSFKNLSSTQIVPFMLFFVLNTTLRNTSTIVRGDMYKNDDLNPYNLYQFSLKNLRRSLLGCNPCGCDDDAMDRN